MAKEEKKEGGAKSYKDDYEMLGQVIADSPHLKRIVLDKLRELKQSFHESAFDQANRREKESKPGDDKKKK
ncbi:MAG: hypothetical protein AB8C84_09495 [Oligoflexales bacterium]